MTNSTEGRRRLKGAEDALNRAEKILGIEEYVSVIQNAPLCIELCGKAIIAYFERLIGPMIRADNFSRR